MNEPMIVKTRDWNNKQFVCRLLREDAKKLHAELSAYLERTESMKEVLEKA